MATLHTTDAIQNLENRSTKIWFKDRNRKKTIMCLKGMRMMERIKEIYEQNTSDILQVL